MRTSKVALGGVLLALVMIALFMAALMPANRLFFLAVSSVFVAVVIMETNVFYGWLFYIASSLMALLLLPIKPLALLYSLFFGLYGIVKGYIEKLHIRWAEVLLKLAFFNLMLFALVKLASALLFSAFVLPQRWPAALIWLAAQAALLVYDYAYTLFLRIYHNRIHRAF